MRDHAKLRAFELADEAPWFGPCTTTNSLQSTA